MCSSLIELVKSESVYYNINVIIGSVVTYTYAAKIYRVLIIDRIQSNESIRTAIILKLHTNFLSACI